MAQHNQRYQSGQTPPPHGVQESVGSPHYVDGQKVVLTQSHVTTRPEAYDGHGFDPRIRAQYSNEPGVIHATRPLEPPKRGVSPEIQAKHEESKKRYPGLNLSEGEFVLIEVKRHPIGIIAQVAASIVAIIILLSFLFSYPVLVDSVGLTDIVPISFGMMALIIFTLVLFIAGISYVAAWVYLRNTFFMTNESVIQELQFNLFSRKEQTVSLGSIEDVSYRRNGILQTMLDYGDIRLSTEGEETTYRFHYVQNPKRQTAILTNAVEAFKNGRPVEEVDLSW